jgi:hypothetical protein
MTEGEDTDRHDVFANRVVWITSLSISALAAALTVWLHQPWLLIIPLGFIAYLYVTYHRRLPLWRKIVGLVFVCLALFIYWLSTR